MDIKSITDVWDRVVGTQPDPPTWLVLLTGVIALAAVIPHSVWHITRNAVTIAHEGGHGLVALLMGRRLEGIRLHSDTSGLTVSRGKPHGLGMVFTAAAGYTAPSLLGLGGAWLLAAGHITALLWGAVALLVAMLVMIRNAYGVLTVVIAGGAFFLISWLTGAQTQAAFAYLAVWFLLLGGVRPVFELQVKRRQWRRGGSAPSFEGGGRWAGGAPDSDADQLARLTDVPPAMWLVLFYAVALCALIGGGRWLLGV
ncbi:M50 family metallopeptidase [Streptantibioticus ferralitis]|uniref:M50 family metallopeptidase n=1 Tax=Streptantibioticus ferralitis TaxID=236510 RepID=A0ABT5YSW7_9ACTN|nr:M50 family metallopeptidase [Streptantibioticus ferralitis]MDF2254600.1 M50 family metallopeptidase [Streptantibioticus ferralitis]